ncbi:MAG: ABC transporter ATP-binding protein [Eubacterium sp.]|nr:ABC transporter ATP-binding protein [Eubacterium sp.]
MKNLFKKIKKLFGKKKEEKKFHGIEAHKYGMINNFIYAIKTSWKYSKAFIISILAFGIISALSMLIGVYLPKIALEMVSMNVTVETMLIVLSIVGLVMLIMSLVTQKLSYMGDYGFDKVQYKLMGNYLNKVFSTDFKNMENPDFLDLTNRAKHALYYGRGFHGYCMRMRVAAEAFAMVLLAGISIVFIHPLLVVILGGLSFITYKIFDNTMNWNKREYQDAMQSNWRKHYYLAGTTRDFNYAKDIRLFGMANWIERIWNDINLVFFKACRKRHNKWVLCEAKMSSVRLIQNVILYSVLIYMMLHRGMSISDFVLYVGLVESFSIATSDLFSNLVWMNMNKMQMDDFRTFMDWKEDEPDAEKNEGTIKDINLDNYEFTFENVSFKYPGHEKYVLKNLNLTIKAGMKLAIVGINGAGKTTLTKLLMRLYEPTEGRILLNGVDVKMYDRTIYHKIFAPVFQNVEVFAFPIWENVSMRECTDTNMDLVNIALERSGLDKKIEKYENGIETQLLRIFDTEGIDLSGGERQRLAMARALYQDRSVIVLDEPTAALDALAEDRMYQEFNKMVEGKTSIFISHRLSSTRFCDQIVLFKDGTVKELGTHTELMEHKGEYAHMYDVQAQYYRQGGEADA